MATFLAPIEKPRGLLLKVAYFFMRRSFGKVSTPIAVFSARMPRAFLSFYGKVSWLDRKLTLPKPTIILIRERVASINTCLYCMDASRWYAMTKSPDVLPKLDALAEYQTSPRAPSARLLATSASWSSTGASARIRSPSCPGTTASARSATSSGWWLASTCTT
jgi:alkylhydroperoxidase family enzyme